MADGAPGFVDGHDADGKERQGKNQNRFDLFGRFVGIQFGIWGR